MSSPDPDYSPRYFPFGAMITLYFNHSFLSVLYCLAFTVKLITNHACMYAMFYITGNETFILKLHSSDLMVYFHLKLF